METNSRAEDEGEINPVFLQPPPLAYVFSSPAPPPRRGFSIVQALLTVGGAALGAVFLCILAKIQGDVREAVAVGKEAVAVGKKAVDISEKALDIMDQAATKKVELGMDLCKGKVVASIRGGYKEIKIYKFWAV